MMHRTNLLTIDWDYFFPVPDPDNLEAAYLYDWGFAETRMNIDIVWPSRAHGFINSGKPLPGLTSREGFWDRFNIDPDATLYFSDSHLYAGVWDVMHSVSERGTKEVWLYDAHHDSGYDTTMKKFRASGKMDCSNWMLNYRLVQPNTKLHVRYPDWKPWAMEREIEPAIKIDRQVDDETSPPMTFQTVHVCRSGAWVPPWNDHDQLFLDFVNAAPVREVTELQDCTPRAWDDNEVKKNAAAIKAMTDKAYRP